MHKTASKLSVGISVMSVVPHSSPLLTSGTPSIRVWLMKLGRWCAAIIFLKVRHNPITQEGAAASATSLLVRSVQLEETFVSIATGI